MAMRRDLESILRKGKRKLPKQCRFAEGDNPAASPRPILATTESPRRVNLMAITDSVRAPVEETAPEKVARNRDSGSNEVVRGTTPVSVRRSPVTRRDAESLLRSKQKPLPADPAGRTRETAADIVVTTANSGSVPGYTFASSAMHSGSALPHLKRENRNHMHSDNHKFTPPKHANRTPPTRPNSRLNLAPVTPDNAAARRYANTQVKPKLDGSHLLLLHPMTEESNCINTRRMDPRGPYAASNPVLIDKRREMSAHDSPSPPSRIIPQKGHSTQHKSAATVGTNKKLSILGQSASKRHHGGSRGIVRPPVKETSARERSRHPKQSVIESLTPPPGPSERR